MPSMTATDRRPTRRLRGPLVVVAIVPIVLAITVAGVSTFALTLEPLGPGSVSGADPVGLIATTEQDDDVLHLYRYEPGASFLTLTSIRNVGPMAITFVGLVEPRSDIVDSALIWPEALLLMPDAPGTVGPDESLPFAPVVIEPGHERAVWIGWRVGSQCVPGQAPPYMPEAGVGLGPLLPFRWSVLGVPRTSEVDLGYAVEALNPLDDPLTVCPSLGLSGR